MALVIEVHDWRFALDLSDRSLLSQIVSFDPLGALSPLLFGVQFSHKLLNLMDHLLLLLNILLRVRTLFLLLVLHQLFLRTHIDSVSASCSLGDGLGVVYLLRDFLHGLGGVREPRMHII